MTNTRRLRKAFWSRKIARVGNAGFREATQKQQLKSGHRVLPRANAPQFAPVAQDGHTDVVVPPDNSRSFADALKSHNVPVKYLELPSGGHGLNRYQGPMWDAWQTQSLEWLAAQGFTFRRNR
ncbi:MAG: hypothetical protein WA117_22425 [Verrucomicrobiia bacterium]